MSNSKINVFRQILQDAEHHGTAFANEIKAAFPDDEMELGIFIDAIFDFYYLMDNAQFIMLLDILCAIFDLPSVSSIAPYVAETDKADTYISFFLETVLYAILEMGGEGS